MRVAEAPGAGRPEPGQPPARDERASIFGDADPYPNLAALANATRAWLAAAPD
jgi:hypothetical protein